MKIKCRQRFTAAVTAAFVMITMVTSCNSESPDDTNLSSGTDTELSQSPVEPSDNYIFIAGYAQDNPIDNAFAKFANERGAEVEENAIFSYLHALKWYEEYFTQRTHTKSITNFAVLSLPKDRSGSYIKGTNDAYIAQLCFALIVRSRQVKNHSSEYSCGCSL